MSAAEWDAIRIILGVIVFGSFVLFGILGRLGSRE
jgi:hypothetical protein